VVAVLVAEFGAADASAAKAKKHRVATPAYYTLKSAKQHCRVNYTRQRITISVRKKHHTLRVHEVRCVYTGAAAGGAGGSTVAFPSNLPTAAVTVTVIPSAKADSFTVAAGEILSVGGAGVLTGNSGSGLSAALVSAAAHGTVTLSRNGTFRYVPQTDFSGIDTFTYRTISSSDESSAPATVTIHVTPVAVPVGAYAVPLTGTLSVAAPGVLTGDLGSGLKAKLVSGPAGGSLSLNADGSFSYTASPTFSGEDSFSFEAVDSAGQASAPVKVTVVVGAIAPQVSNETFVGAVGNTELAVGGSGGSGPEVYEPGESLLANDVDPNGGTLSTPPETITTNAGGAVTINADGSFNYQPPVGFDGPTDSFGYVVDASEGTSASATATIDFNDARVWYVNNAAAPGGGGSSTAPFSTLAAAVSAAGENDTIFLFGSTTSYSGGVTLGSDETLAGEPGGLTVDSETLLAASSSGPAATISGGSTGVTLGDGDNLTGVTIENTSGDAVAMGTGTFNIDDVTIAGAGADAINATGNANVTVQNSTITASTGDGIHLSDAIASSSYEDFDIADNLITGSQHAAIALSYAGNANGDLSGNTVGVSGTAASGSALGDGIDLTSNGSSARLVAGVFGNNVYGIAEGSGIDALATGGATLEMPLDRNTIRTDATSAGNGITVAAGTGPSDAATVCMEASNNPVTAAGSNANGIEVESPDASSQFGIQGYTNGTGVAGVSSWLKSDNTLSVLGSGAQALATPSGGGFINCTVQEPAI
jgi:hypothetical protein